MAQIAEEIEQMEAEVLTVPADVTDEEQVRALMRQVNDRYGRIDVLVNNAGIVPHFAWGGPRWAPIRDIEKSFWDKVLNTNLGGTVLCSKHAEGEGEGEGEAPRRRRRRRRRSNGAGTPE